MKGVSGYLRTAAMVLPMVALLPAGQAFAAEKCLLDVDYTNTKVVTGIGNPVQATGTQNAKYGDAVTDVNFDVKKKKGGGFENFKTKDLDEALEGTDSNGEHAYLDTDTGKFVTKLPDAINVVGYNNVTFGTAIASISKDWGGATATGSNAFACGPQAEATGQNATALGDEARAHGTNATATGQDAHAHGNDATAVGQNADADGENATALGQGSQAHGDDATAVGENSHAHGQNATAIGQEAQAFGRNATAVGQDANAFGPNATALGQDSTAFGPNATAVGQDSSAFGSNATAVGQDSAAFGRNATAVGQDSAAFGRNATAVGQDASAFGRSSTAVGQDSLAIGSNATAMGQFSTAQGDHATALGQGSLAIGDVATAVGQGSRAEVDGTAVGQNAVAVAGGTALGSSANASGYATSIGRDSGAAENGTAIGNGARANANGSVAIGRDSTGQAAVANNQNEFVLGTANHTYTAPGITSGASRAAQSGPLEVVTTDKNGHLASDGGLLYNTLSEFGAGIAIAMSLENPDLVGNERFGIAANLGFFEGNVALGVSMMGVLGHNFTGNGERWALSGAVGVSLDNEEFGGHSAGSTVAGRAGVQVSW